MHQSETKDDIAFEVLAKVKCFFLLRCQAIMKIIFDLQLWLARIVSNYWDMIGHPMLNIEGFIRNFFFFSSYNFTNSKNPFVETFKNVRLACAISIHNTYLTFKRINFSNSMSYFVTNNFSLESGKIFGRKDENFFLDSRNGKEFNGMFLLCYNFFPFLISGSDCKPNFYILNT